MKRFAFIHGSSVGQSTFVPTDAVEDICKVLADWYFKGRISRQKSSAANEALFVDLCKDQTGNPFVVYSYVNNSCRGKSDDINKLGRPGQYFALSVVCEDAYLFPEEIYRMLRAAYEQMFQKGNILGFTDNEVQYRIAQFSEQSEYLSAFLAKVITNFDKFAGTGKKIKADCHFADYDSWTGEKVSLDICNSIASYDKLCKTGRLYVSDTYESPYEKNSSLERELQNLKKERTDLEEQISKMKKSAGAKTRDEISKLQEVINAQEEELKSSKSKLKECEAMIDIVHEQLGKYAKLGQKISNAQEKKSQYEDKDKKDLLKTCLIFIVMFLTIANGLLSYCFFRGISPDTPSIWEGEKEQIVERPQDTQQHGDQSPQTSAAIGTETEKSTSFLTVSLKSITAEAQEKQERIQIETDGVWNAPVVPEANRDWLSLEKISKTELQVIIKENNTSGVRKSVFMIGSGSFQQQITVTQKGKVVSEQTCPNYAIVIKDDKGNILSKGDNVFADQILIATVTNPSMSATGYGWTCSNCTSPHQNKNVKENRFTVSSNLNDGAIVAIGYGKLDNGELREKIQFKFVKSQNSIVETPPASPESANMVKKDSTEAVVTSTPSTSNE